MADEEKKVSLVLDGKVEGLLSAMMQGQKAVESGVGAMTQQFGMLTGTLGKIPGIMGIVTAALAGGGMKDAIDTTKEVVGEVNKLSRTLGVTAGQASVLRVAIDDAFLTVEDVTGGVNRLTKQLLTNEDAIKKLGVQTRDSNGNYRESLDIMLEVNSALSKIKAGTDQNVAGMSVYGRGWGEARNLMRLTSEAVDDARARAERLHLIFGSEGQRQVREYRSAMKDLDDVAESMKVTIGRELIPALTSLSVAFGEAGASVADGFGSSLRESMRMMAEHSLALNTFFKKASAIMNGGPLGTNWLTKSGRAEIGAELDAIEQLQQYGMERIAGRYGSYVKPASAPSQKDRLPGDFNDKNSGPSETDKQYQDYINELNGLNRAIAESNPYLDQQDKAMTAVYATVDKLSEKLPQYAKSWNLYGEAMEQNIRLAEQLKTATEEHEDYLKGDSYQNYMGRMGTQRSKQADGSWQSQQDMFDESAMLSGWAAARESARQADLQAEQEFHVLRASIVDEGLSAEIMQQRSRYDAFYSGWVMMADTEDQFRQRKAELDHLAIAQEENLIATSQQRKNSYLMQGAQAAIGIMQMFGNKNRAVAMASIALQKGLNIATTMMATTTGSMLAYASQLIPGDPTSIVRAEVARDYTLTQGYISAGIIAAQGLAEMALAATGGAAGSYGGGTPSSPVVTQPVPAQQPAGPQITVVIQGNLIGHDDYVENHLAPTFIELVGRSVDFGFEPRKGY